MSEITCPRCSTPIEPARKGDFFDHCTYACLKAAQDEYEAGQADGYKDSDEAVLCPGCNTPMKSGEKVVLNSGPGPVVRHAACERLESPPEFRGRGIFGSRGIF